MAKHVSGIVADFFNHEDAIIAACSQSVVEEAKMLYWPKVFDALLQKQFEFRSAELGFVSALAQALSAADSVRLWGTVKTQHPYQRLTKQVPSFEQVTSWLARKPNNLATLFDLRIHTRQGPFR